MSVRDQPSPRRGAGDQVSRLAQALRATPVAGRVLKALRTPADRVLVALERPPFTVSVEGRVLAGYLRHRAYVAHLAAGYEDYARRLFVDALQPGAVVVDGGAHIGLYTVISAHRIGASGHVYAFEADPYNAPALRLNVRRNQLDNVTVIARALADREGEHAYHVSSGTIASSLVVKRAVHDAHEITVRTTTIDATLDPARRTSPIVVKLDVEGAEERVLRGAEQTLRACSAGHVLAEHNPSALSDGGSSGSAVLRVLREYGFTPYFIDERQRALIPISGIEAPPEKGNLWAVKGP